MSRQQPTRYTWNGEQLTLRQVCERVPAYSQKWIERALKAGCCCMADFAKHEASQRARSLERSKVGARMTDERIAGARMRFGKGRA